jgi:hypothetical protein
MGWDSPTPPEGRIRGVRLLHMGRVTSWGCTLCSQFYIGQDQPAAGKSPQKIAETLPDLIAQGLLQHRYNKLTSLSHFLPSLFIAENRQTHKVSMPR